MYEMCRLDWEVLVTELNDGDTVVDVSDELKEIMTKQMDKDLTDYGKTRVSKIAFYNVGDGRIAAFAAFAAVDDGA